MQSKNRIPLIAIMATLALGAVVAFVAASSEAASPPATVANAVRSTATQVARSVEGVGIATCRKAHFASCAGHLAQVGGRTVYMLDDPVTIGVGAHISRLGNQSLRNHGNDECASSLGAGQGADAVDWGCNGSANQTWDVFVHTGVIQAWGFENKGDHLCLNNRRGSEETSPLPNVQIVYACDDDQNEQYNLNAQNGGFHIETIKFDEFGGAAPSGKCVSSYAYTLYGEPLMLANCNGDNNQTWGSD